MKNLKEGSFIATYSIEEPFYLAKLVKIISENKIKIKWLEKQHVTKKGTKYSLSYDDHIQSRNIICQITLLKETRFRFLLSTEEEKRILTLSREDSDEDSESCDLTEGTKSKREQENEKYSLSIRDIVDKGYFNETESLFNGPMIVINESQKIILLGENNERFLYLHEPHDSTHKINIISDVVLEENWLNKKLNEEKEPENEENKMCTLAESKKEVMSDEKQFIDGDDGNVRNEEQIVELLLDSEGNLFNKKLNEGKEQENKENNGMLCAPPETNKEVMSEEKLFIGGDDGNERNQEQVIELPLDSEGNLFNEELHEEKEQENEKNKMLCTLPEFKNGITSEMKHLILEDDDNMSNQEQIAEVLSDSPTPPYVDSGSEYIPSTSEDSDIEIPYKHDISVRLNRGNSGSDSETSAIPKNLENLQLSTSLESTLESASRTKVNSIPTELPLLSDDELDKILFVKSSGKTETGKRIYDKKHVCYFCQKPVCKMTRHLSEVHSNESEVARLLAFAENSHERKEGFLCILRAGDYYHNIEVLTTKKGELILSRRPSVAVSYKKYGPCPNCLGFFLTSTLWHHIKYSCPKKSDFSPNMVNDRRISRRDVKGESYALLGQHLNISIDFVRDILSNFRNDEIGEICRGDEIITKFGAMLYEKYTEQQHDHIRQSMRQLSRLFLESKSIDFRIEKLQDLLIPKNFDILISAVHKLCVAGKDEVQTRFYNIPSLALKLGHSLRKCALIVRGIALRQGDLTTNTAMESFMDLMTLEWNAKVSSTALRTLMQKKINATQLLPVTDDIMCLNKLLDTIIKEYSSDKNLMLSIQKWQTLAQATLCKIILFNKRRSGEASRMTLKQYATRPNWQEQCTSELKESLTNLEIDLANKLTVIEVIGKSRKNFKVPVLLTQDTKLTVDILIRTRDQVGIARDNLYVFPKSGGSKKPLRGHDCIRRFARDANLQQPSSITSTKLRKYIATVVQILDLKTNEYDWLARHLGHDIKIHRDFYRLHESAVELTKISRLLLTVDRGEINKFKGKNLDEINVSDLPSIESETENNNNEENEDTDEDAESPRCIEKKNTLPQKKIVPKSNEDTNEADGDAESSQCIEKKNSLPPKKRISKEKPSTSARTQQRRPWSAEEKEVLLKFFRHNIKHGIVPNKEQADKCIAENQSTLETRSWRDIKNWIYNKMKSLKQKK